MENNLWIEKYRPSTLDGYVGNEELKSRIAGYIAKQDIPHLLFSGLHGTGKTTIAKLLVKHIACDLLFINAADERGIDVIRDKIRGFAATSGFAPLKIVVLDEASALTPDAQTALLNMMEVFSQKTRFILTCNYIERIIPPIVSRCQTSIITPPSKKEVAIRLASILDAEDVSYDKQSIAVLVNAYYPDIRRIIGAADQQSKDGKLTVMVSEVIASDSKLKIMDTLMSNQTDINKILEIRQVVADAGIRDFTELYRTLYDRVQDYAPDKIPQTIINIAEGQFRDAFVPDKEVTFMATIYKILIT